MPHGRQSLITTSINMADSFFFQTVISVEKLDRKIPLFYRELLDHFQELRSNYKDPLKQKFILWNKRVITVENKSVFWKAWWGSNVPFVQDLLTIKVIIFHHKNSAINITSKLTFCNATKSPQLFPLISKVTHQFIWTLGF